MIKNIEKWLKNHIAFLICLATAALITTFLIVGTTAENGSRTLDGSTAKIPESTEEFISNAKIVMSDQAKKALVTLDGVTTEEDLPTVDEIDAPQATPKDEAEVGGQGWTVPTDTYTAFRNATNGKCVDTDGAYGSQCWDLGNLFWQNYAGRWLSTCNKGGAKNTIEDGCWQKNAGNDFVMIWDKSQIQPGDWVVSNSGTWGHIFMAVGYPNGDYIAAFGTNQGGASCSGGGAVANTINYNMKSVVGAFRPKTYQNNPSPSPSPSPSPTPVQPTADQYTVQRGDTLGGISLNMGWWPSTSGLYGDDGYAQRLADFNNIVNRGLIYPNQVIKRLK
jgi:LysM repeat protein